MRICSKCKLEKSLDAFYKRKDSHGSWCKECQSVYNKINREKRVETVRAARQKLAESISPEETLCVRCYKVKPNNQFGGRKKCLDCSAYVWQNQYGLTSEEVTLVKGVTACQVCGDTEKLNVDHCHERMVFRGVICSGCNTALGMAKDNPATLRGLADYLEQFLLRQ